MARPIKHRGKWRIRWPDATGERQSEVYDDYKAAQVALSRHLAEVDEVRRGLRAPDPPDKTFDELCDLWEEKRVPQKRSGGNDRSVIRQLKKHVGGKRVRQIGIEDADEYVDSRDDIEPKTIANHLTLLISMLNYAASLKVPWILRVPDFKRPKVIVLGRDYRYHVLRMPSEAVCMKPDRLWVSAEEVLEVPVAQRACTSQHCSRRK